MPVPLLEQQPTEAQLRVLALGGTCYPTARAGRATPKVVEYSCQLLANATSWLPGRPAAAVYRLARVRSPEGLLDEAWFVMATRTPNGVRWVERLLCRWPSA